MKFLRISFIVIILFAFTVNLFSQRSERPFTLRLGVGMTENEPVIYSDSYKERFGKVPLYNLEFGYEVFKNFNISAYGGYAYYKRVENIETIQNNIGGREYTKVSRLNSNALFYGVKVKYDIIPNMRFELYPTLTLGGVNSVWSDKSENNTSLQAMFEYSVGAGASFRITKGVGLYFEYAFGHFFSDVKHRIQGGVSFHF